MTSKKEESQTIGELLRITREQKKKTLPDVAKKLCIQQAYLRSIEENDATNLPDQVFVLGYVRTYANYLKLDALDILKRFKIEQKNKFHQQELHFPEPQDAKKLPPKTIAIVFSTIALLLIAGFGISSYWEDMQKTNLELEAFLESDTEIESKPNTPMPSSDPDEESLSETLDDIADIKKNDSIAESTDDDKKTTNFQGIVIKAKEDSWVQIATEEGSIIISKILRIGEIYQVPEREAVFMDTGNAGGLEVIINGVNIGTMGVIGQIRRDVVLNEKNLKQIVTTN